jgi:hypothetical protein
MFSVVLKGTFTSFFTDKRHKEDTKQYKSRGFLLVLLDVGRTGSES